MEGGLLNIQELRGRHLKGCFVWRQALPLKVWCGRSSYGLCTDAVHGGI